MHFRQKEDEKQQKQAAAKAKREADKAEKQWQTRMIDMKSAPEAWLRKADDAGDRRRGNFDRRRLVVVSVETVSCGYCDESAHRLRSPDLGCSPTCVLFTVALRVFEKSICRLVGDI